MKTVFRIGFFVLIALTISGCVSSQAIKKKQTPPAFIIKPNEPIAIMPTGCNAGTCSPETCSRIWAT